MEDFEIINILGSSVSSATFKAKSKLDETTYVLKGVSLEHCDDTQKKILVKKIYSRKELRHPNILRITGVVEQNEANILYMVQEYCSYGSLKNFVREECVAKERYLHEDLLFRILYQIAIALRTIDDFIGHLSIDNIFLDADYNVKLYNFHEDFKNASKQRQPKMSHLGTVMYELCTLKAFEKTAWEKELGRIYHLTNVAGVIGNVIKDNSDAKKNINKILCHPTVLLRSSQWTKDSCFVSVTTPKQFPTDEESVDWSTLKSRERALRSKERNLLDREKSLENREKKLLLMEITLKDKLQQAELYLKRCRGYKQSLSSGSSKSSIRSQAKKTYEDFDDGTYAGDSIIEPPPPPAKSNGDKKTFTRTLSERRIRFKTSPLKDNNGFNRKTSCRKTTRHSKISEEKENVCGRRKSALYENELVVRSNVLYENGEKGVDRGLGWAEETKKHAFELLRLMNFDKENAEVKHTYL